MTGNGRPTISYKPIWVVPRGLTGASTLLGFFFPLIPFVFASWLLGVIVNGPRKGRFFRGARRRYGSLDEVPAGWTNQQGQYRVLVQQPILFRSDAEASRAISILLNALNKELFETAQGAFFFIRPREGTEHWSSLEAVEPNRDWLYWFSFDQKGVDVQWRLNWAEVDSAGRWSNGWHYEENSSTPTCRYLNDPLFDECRTRLTDVISRVLTKELLVDDNRRHFVRELKQSGHQKQTSQMRTIERSRDPGQMDYGDDL